MPSNAQAYASRSPFWPQALPPAIPAPETSLWLNLEVSAARYPDKAAYVFFGKALTYHQLRAQAVNLSNRLLTLGVRKGDRVCVFMQNTPAFAVIFYAAWRLGVVVVPVNPMCKADELAYFMGDSGSKVVFCATDLLPVAVQARQSNCRDDCDVQLVACAYADYMASEAEMRAEETPSPEVHAWLRDDRHRALANHRLADLVADSPQQDAQQGIDSVQSDDLALIVYTSGTTGFPKGCMHTHRTLMGNAILGYWNNTTAGVVSLASAPMFHITGILYHLLINVFVGTSTVLINRWDKRLAARLIRKYGITHWTCIPTMVVDVMGDEGYRDFGFQQLRYLSGGGAGMPRALADRLHAEFGLAFVEGYGLTETVATVLVNPPQRPKHQCLGIPVSCVTALVIDVDTQAILGDGQTGEIVVASPTVFTGYWNKPQEYAASFIELDGTRFLRTGDVGYRDDEGYFFLTDRAKRMINASGFKVWPSEVEALFYRNDKIREVCVIGVKDDYRGESVKALVALKPSAQGVTAEEIRHWAREHMAAYKVPKFIEFVDALPKSGSGKILWRQLQEAANAIPSS